MVTSLCLRENSVSQGIETEITALRQQVAELCKPQIPPPLPSTFTDLLTELSEKSIPNIEQKLTEMSNTISELQANCKKASTVPGTQTIKASPPPNRAFPNTTSPHAKATITPCKAYIEYKSAVVPSDLKNNINDLVQAHSSEFVTVGSNESREVMYFGEHEYLSLIHI